MMARSLFSWGGFKELVHCMDFGDAWARHTIIAAGADVNAAAAAGYGGRTAIQAAADRGDLEVINRLKEADA
ncbi:hypothetical protein FOMA001_g20320 [Fusarium oxysporum f. sp. matthiolae]|nr:hypothetical protein FOMA001_g20320 [Fusarium oxysporum f. sp. matthiolae]